MWLVVISIISWWAGLAAYIGGLWLLWGQTVGGDLGAVVFWSALAAGLSVVLAYAPVMFALRARYGARSGWMYPLGGAAAGVVAVLFIAGVWSDGDLVRAMLSQEAALFLCMFATFGVVFGSGFFLAYGRRSV